MKGNQIQIKVRMTQTIGTSIELQEICLLQSIQKFNFFNNFVYNYEDFI